MSRSAARARSGQDRTSLYSEITDKIIAELEAGRVPWVQPWGTAAAKAPLAMPKNAATSAATPASMCSFCGAPSSSEGFAGQSWLTFRQALSLGGNVRKGEHGTTVVYADRFMPDDERKRAERDGDEARAIPFLKRFTVFNTDQCENLPGGLVTAAAACARGSDPAAGRGADRRDRRRFPHRRRPRLLQPERRISCRCRRRDAYFEPINWHRTALHELGHWVGHPSRLARDLSGIVRLEDLCPGGTGRRDDQRLRLRLARHRADRAPRRLYRLLARGAARGQPRHRARRERRLEGGRLPARLPARTRRRPMLPPRRPTSRRRPDGSAVAPSHHPRPGRGASSRGRGLRRFS